MTVLQIMYVLNLEPRAFQKKKKNTWAGSASGFAIREVNINLEQEVFFSFHRLEILKSWGQAILIYRGANCGTTLTRHRPH